MSTIASRLREIAGRIENGCYLLGVFEDLTRLATELEAAPAADAVPVMAQISTSVHPSGVPSGIFWFAEAANLQPSDYLVRHSDHLSAIAALQAEVAQQQEQIRKLKTVMVAAAEEIHEHWQAHCDAEGYGPQNLMHRLEAGIPSEYGYTAGAFAALQARIAELEARQVQQANRLFAHIEHGDAEHRAWLRREIDAFFTADPAPICRPKGREAGRMGDMAPPGHSHMRVGLDGDNDVYVSVWEQEREAWAGIEFCTYSGGGKSPKTREALLALMVAIEADNAETPSHQWPRVAAPSNPTTQPPEGR